MSGTVNGHYFEVEGDGKGKPYEYVLINGSNLYLIHVQYVLVSVQCMREAFS